MKRPSVASATQLPTLMRRVATPISWAVASASLLTSAQNTASNPASSATRATSWISAARHPAPRCGSIWTSPRPNFSGMTPLPHVLLRDWLAVASHSTPLDSFLRQPQQAAGQHEVGLVDHLAVEGEGAGIRVGGKGGDDALGPFALGRADRECLVDRGELGRMDRHLGGEARAPPRQAFGFEPGLVSKIGVDRVDRDDLRRGRREQAQRTRQLVGAVIFAVDRAVASADRGR